MNAPNRLSVVENLYFQEHGKTPAGWDGRWTRSLTTDEQPYSRKLKLTEEWTSLDTGWLDGKCGMLLIRNNPIERWTIPTQEEAALAAERIVEIGGYGSGGLGTYFLIRPGETFRGEPARIENLWLRCCKGECTVLMVLIPS